MLICCKEVRNIDTLLLEKSQEDYSTSLCYDNLVEHLSKNPSVSNGSCVMSASKLKIET